MTREGITQRESIPGDGEPGVTIARVSFELHRDAFGVGESRPRLSWTIETVIPGWRQTAYELEAYGSDGRLVEWTDKVESNQSVLVPWPFSPLSSRERRTIRVRVWGTDGQASAWSMATPVEAGLLTAEDWEAQFVTPDWEEDTTVPQPCPLLRREFVIHEGVTRARLYVTSLGVYEVQLNGMVVGDHVLAPGWTSYHNRLRYQTFDVTNLLRKGLNAICAILGDGWYRGRFGFDGGRRNIYGDRLALLVQLEIDYTDGTTVRICTDETWRAATGPMLASDLYDGETYDARLERPGWSGGGYDDSDWCSVRRVDWDLATLVAPSGPPVRRIELVAPIAISTSPSGHAIVDFGQNLVGRLRLVVRGEAGQTITLRHAEVLENGELCTRPLRTAQATDRYTLRGEGLETWEPRFTFHGFRYAQVDGWPGTLRAEDLLAVVCHSDMERTGWFECSDPKVNQLHENAVWSMRGNFLDVPTDCPQRDERLGWTGDILAFAPTACFLYDCAGFLTSWLADLAAEQTDEGVVPFVIPNILPMRPLPAAAWGDAAVFVPWVLYQRYGDAGILAAQYESMCAWVNLLTHIAGEKRLWNKGFQFGDWLDPSAPSDKPGAGPTNPYVVATAYYAHSAELLGQIAQVLGRAEDAAHYLRLAEEVRSAFDAEYVTPAGRVLSDSATAYTLALQFGLLLDAAQRRRAGVRLAALIRNSGYHISTGYVGTPLICDALCSAGEYDTAFHLLKQQGCPSWLYPVTMGATTIWERWDSLLPDGSVNPNQMTSFNHYALGAIADWLHRTVAGLAPAAPGYNRIAIQPHPGGGLTYAHARHITPYGLAESRWVIEGEQIEVVVVVPPNTTASVTLPGRDDQPIEIGAGSHRWSYSYHLKRFPQPRSLNNTIGEFIDDPEAWTTVLTMMRQHMPQLSSHLDVGSIVQWDGNMTLEETLSLLPNATALRAALEDALAKLGP